MPRPSSRPQLSEIDPRSIAIDATRRAIESMWKDVLLLSPLLIRIPQPSDAEAESTDLAQTAKDLLSYALHGGELDADEVDEMIATVTRACGLHITEDALDPLELVMLAADARARLSESAQPAAGSIAALAGVTADHVRLLARQGEVDLGRPADVRRWLKARGVGV